MTLASISGMRQYIRHHILVTYKDGSGMKETPGKVLTATTCPVTTGGAVR